MVKIFSSSRFITILIVILTAASMRLIPHWPNFTPVAAIALFGGAMFNRKYLAFLIPLSALFISDMIIGFHSGMPAVYISFAITVMIGMGISKRINAFSVITGSFASSVIFFIITNFAAWYASPIYSQNLNGLLQSYIAGLAFFNDGNYGMSMFLNELAGGLLYNTLFFGVFYLASLRFPSLVKA